MLRRKLLLLLASLVVLMMAMAITAIWLLQGVLHDLDRANSMEMAAADTVMDLDQRISLVEMELYQLQLGQKRHLDGLLTAVEELHRSAAALGAHEIMRAPGLTAIYQHFMERLVEFEHQVGNLGTAQDPELAVLYNRQAINSALELHRADLEITRTGREYAQQGQQHVSDRLRWLVLGVSIGFLTLINATILLLVRAASMILRPVHKLVHASRELGREHFDHRVHLTGHDEFDELGRAYNQLGEQLQASEQRKIEMMQQTALTLNHELNNTLSIIEMQLALLTQRAGNDPAFEKCLHQIRQSLDRMKHTVGLLRQVRRIVLTDYTQGVKMLDLQRSTEPPPPESAPQLSAQLPRSSDTPAEAPSP